MTRTLAVFGITGRTGLALAREAAARGWAVRGLARPGRPLPGELAGALVVCGDVRDPARVAETVAGAGAASVVFGPKSPYTEVSCAAATEAVGVAMREAGVRRLVCQTGARIGAWQA